MQLWIARERDGAAGYCVSGQFRVVAGAPVCAAERLGAVSAELQEDAARNGQRLIYFGAGERLERILGGSPAHHLLRLGGMPVWAAAAWPEIVETKASLRAQIHRARNKGVHVSEWKAIQPPRLAELRRVLELWLGTRGLPPLHFMTEPDILSDLRDRRVFVAERDGAVVAFLVATPIPARGGWLVEQWPRRPDAPNGTSQVLVDAAMRAFAAAGEDFVTLGLAPLSDRAGRIGEGEPLWVRALMHWMRAHGRRFYNFRGLDAFKASLEPEMWEPIYAVMPGPEVTPGMLRAVAGVFGGGSPEALLLRALWMAARRELVALGRAAHQTA